jgi:hypothetical protein
MNEKVLVGPKFGTLIPRKWITNIWVVTTGYHATDPKIRTQWAKHGRSWIATKHGDGTLETSNAQRTAQRDTKLYPGLGPSW